MWVSVFDQCFFFQPVFLCFQPVLLCVQPVFSRFQPVFCVFSTNVFVFVSDEESAPKNYIARTASENGEKQIGKSNQCGRSETKKQRANFRTTCKISARSVHAYTSEGDNQDFGHKELTKDICHTSSTLTAS